MFGQWIGKIEGTNTGFCVLNIEERDQSIGRIMFHDFDPKFLSMWATVSFVKNENGIISGSLSNFWIFHNGILKQNTEIDNVIYPTSGKVEGIIREEKIEGSFKTNTNSSGKFILEHADKEKPEKADHEIGWEDFKSFINVWDDGESENIYRGHESADYRLKTFFHRMNRLDLFRYLDEDISKLAYYINSISEYKYDKDKPADVEALLSLAQHHGYPTPFLDWTESPYVAAYFAYQRAIGSGGAKNVRIYSFRVEPWREFWSKIQPTSNIFRAPKPIISIHRLPVFNNSRALPQQSIFMFSNVVDMEDYLDSCKTLLSSLSSDFFLKFDLPYSEKDLVIKDLRKMGITAATLFPGIDGACKFLKEKYF